MSKVRSTSHTDDTRRGVALIVLSGLLFSVMNATVKWLTPDLSVVEIGFFRQFFSLIPIGIIIAQQGGLPMLKTKRPYAHMFRAVIGNATMIPFFLSVLWLPLASATAISFAQPLFITALSVPLLRESVGVHRWSAVVVGFIGILIVTRPGADWFAHDLGWGSSMALLSAFLSALMMITIRQLNRTEPPIRTVFYFASVGSLGLAFLLPLSWVTPSPSQWALLLFIGILGGLAQYVMTDAYRHAPAAVLAPFGYGTILWSVVLGYALWSDLPNLRIATGVMIVIASGLYIFYREARRHKQVATAPAIPAAS